MSYVAPYIDSSGIHIPSYNDILENLIDEMKSIFGNDIYLDEDSQDYQQLSIQARKIFDVFSLAVLVYNNRTPINAIGTGLDNLCAMVGIKRKPADYSMCNVTITGDQGTVIVNGKVSDGNNIWDLPSTVTIPSSGQIVVQAKCESAGNIFVPAGSITIIETPVYGWNSVTNTVPYQIGSNVETDANLRGRFQRATELPSQSIFEGMIASLEDIPGVSRLVGYENDTNSTSAEGLPPHSVCFVVEGGDDDEVAKSIYYKKAPGVYTYGTTSVSLTDIYGNTSTINFYRPVDKDIYMNVYITKLNGYTSDYEDKIKEAIIEYINSLKISSDVLVSAIWSVAMSQMNSLSSPAYSITNVELSEDGITYSSLDISCAFNEAAKVEEANITLMVSP